VLLPDKSPALVASAVHRILTEPTARESLVAAGRARAARFAPDIAAAAFCQAIEAALRSP